MTPQAPTSPFDQGLLTIAPHRVEDFFSQWVQKAIELAASDLHFHAVEAGAVVTVRRLGKVFRLGLMTRDDARRLQTYVKMTAGLDVTRTEHPLDGRLARRLPNQETVDIRISTIPTLFGEDMALRLLQRKTGLLNLDQLGFDPRGLYQLTKLLHQPNGLVLITGPTGTGKTTTLYACLNYLNDGTRKINTIEDPIEYLLPGIHQSQVNLRRRLDFQELLRGVLRQSPDVVMVGEVRDPVTAETLVRAANSGQLVFATCHAPTAVGAIESLLALGVQSHFLAHSLRGVVAQRLVDVLCPTCKISEDLGPSTPVFDRVRQWLRPGEGRLLYRPVGCEICHRTGVLQRTAVAEILRITPTIRQMIESSSPVSEIHAKAVEMGMVDLHGGVLLKAAAGATGLDTARGMSHDLRSREADSAVSFGSIPDGAEPLEINA